MALAEQRFKQTTVQDGNAYQTTRVVDSPVAEEDHRKNVAARVVWYVAGVVLALLALRFLLALLGANTGSGFVSFMYAITTPFVAPFFGAFSYDYVAGQSRFESFTLLAMAVYALLAYGISRLLTLNRRTGDDV